MQRTEVYEIPKVLKTLDTLNDRVLQMYGSTDGSDIKYNNFEGKLRIPFGNDPDPENGVCLRICPFTNNCGVKAISHFNSNYYYSRGDHFRSVSKDEQLACLNIFESWLFHHCNASILVGSDYVNGVTISLARIGAGYVLTEEVHNNNYYRQPHKIQLFYKNLIPDQYKDHNWKRLDSPSVPTQKFF